MTRRVYGVGINDANYPVTKKLANGKEWRCPFYKTWKNMLARCYSLAYRKQYAEREGSFVDARWHRFSDFKDWMEQQDWEGKSLDKDVLVDGNQNYGPETALFVSKQVNVFFSKSSASSGYRCVYRNGNQWRVSAMSFKENQQVFTFHQTLEDAIKAAPQARYQSALELAELQDDHRIAHVLRTRFLP